MYKIDPLLLGKLHKPAPRYTSYPTAVDWYPLNYNEYFNRLREIKSPLSLYIHIPFCASMCLYCGCSVILNRKAENEERYVETLIKEIMLVAQALDKKQRVVQLHFGGGTPTKLSESLLIKIMDRLNQEFIIDYTAEVAIEVDPRTVFEDEGKKLRLLKKLGFNRISFGVQDTNERVQEAVKRRQSKEMTFQTFYLAKELGFDKINIDLIYGLPHQNQATFKETIGDIITLKPDRLALFSYAKVPWLKKHQNAIKEETLPSFTEKFAMYTSARNHLIEKGYVAIGMDHFALQQDELSQAYHNKTLTRNFQGYSTTAAKEFIGVGVTAIGYVGGGYFQNQKELKEYEETIAKGILPITRGFLLSDEDLFRKKVIHSLMCNFELEKSERILPLLQAARESLQEFEREGLIIENSEKICVTKLGELFVRNIAMLFDEYLHKRSSTNFSQSI